jgi:CheY-like chemotaxis protein
MASTTKTKADQAFTQTTVLIAEDEVLIRHHLAEQLRAAGFVVVEARTAREARTLLDTGTRPSVLLTDLRMPNALDGLSLARHVRLHSPHTKIVLMSGNLGEADMTSVADATFSKPVDGRALVQKFHELTGGRDATEQESA